MKSVPNYNYNNAAASDWRRVWWEDVGKLMSTLLGASIGMLGISVAAIALSSILLDPQVASMAKAAKWSSTSLFFALASYLPRWGLITYLSLYGIELDRVSKLRKYKNPIYPLELLLYSLISVSAISLFLAAWIILGVMNKIVEGGG